MKFSPNFLNRNWRRRGIWAAIRLGLLLTVGALAVVAMHSQGVSDSRLDVLIKDQVQVEMQQARNIQRVADMDVRVRSIEDAKLDARLARVETTEDNNRVILVGIGVGVLLLIVETVVSFVKKQ